MIIQQALFEEMAVDFLMMLMLGGEFEKMRPEEINDLLNRIRKDIDLQLAVWISSDKPCDKATELSCDASKQDCVAGHCPFKIFGEEYAAVFSTKLNRLIHRLRKKYLFEWNLIRKKSDETKNDNWTSQDWWFDFFEDHKKELAVKLDRKAVTGVLSQSFSVFSADQDRSVFWRIKTRKRRDGQVVFNVSFTNDFLQKWPASIQDELLALSSPMRPAVEIIPLIRHCAHWLATEMKIRDRAIKKRLRQKKKREKRASLMKKLKPRSVARRQRK
ncbi:MAG: hypothetical protein ACOZBH_02405 [Patescibacteria group bacterium]